MTKREILTKVCNAINYHMYAHYTNEAIEAQIKSYLFRKIDSMRKSPVQVKHVEWLRGILLNFNEILDGDLSFLEK